MLHDIDGRDHAWDLPQVICLLECLHLAPRTQQELAIVQQLYKEEEAQCIAKKGWAAAMHVALRGSGEEDSADEIEPKQAAAEQKAKSRRLDVEALIVQIREKIGSMRRARMHALVAEGNIEDDLVREFCDEIGELKDRFDALVQKGASHLAPQDLRILMAEYGMRPTTRQQMEMVMTMIRTLAAEDNRRFIFPETMDALYFVRQVAKDARHQELTEVFQQFDKDKRRSLSMQECAQMLSKMNLCPKNRTQQRHIATILEAVDVDGSGDYDIDEVAILFQRVAEMIARDERKEELRIAKELGLTLRTIEDHHDVFMAFDITDRGVLRVADLRKLVDSTRVHISAETMSQMVRAVDDNESGLVEFPEFLKFVTFLDRHADREKARKAQRKGNRDSVQSSAILC